MKLLQELATEVLLGTERRPPALPPVGGGLGEVLAAAARPDDGIETLLLRTAGALAVCGDAGYVPPAAAEPPTPCPPETLRRIDDPVLVAALRAILDDGPDPLRHEALRLFAAKGACLPPRLLPRALALGQKTPSLRPVLLPALGRRGEWLARQEPAWSYAVGGQDNVLDDALWEHGTQEQRKLFHVKLRASDPARARTLLQAALGEMDARERAALVEQMATGLSLADEDFIEGLLVDRSKEVRQCAAGLLARLPGSRYAARMGERMAACVKRERKLFRQVWVLEPPERFAADWKADGLEEKRGKDEPLGERAWWLCQIAAALPLGWWTAHTGMTPEELLKWAAGSDWTAALFRAWAGRLASQPDAEWARAFLANPQAAALAADASMLIAQLPPAERERHWLRQLEAGSRTVTRGDLLRQVVASLGLGGAFVSAGFAQRVLDEIRATLHTDACRWDYNLRNLLPEFICLLPPQALGDAIQGWPAGRPETEYFSETLARILALADQRQTLYRTFS